MGDTDGPDWICDNPRFRRTLLWRIQEATLSILVGMLGLSAPVENIPYENTAHLLLPRLPQPNPQLRRRMVDEVAHIRRFRIVADIPPHHVATLALALQLRR